jgi:hypothetical protein
LYRVLWQKCSLKNSFDADLGKAMLQRTGILYKKYLVSQMTTSTNLVKNHINSIINVCFGFSYLLTCIIAGNVSPQTLHIPVKGPAESLNVFTPAPQRGRFIVKNKKTESVCKFHAA